LKEWLKELPNVLQNIRSEKWGYWKKPKRQLLGLSMKDIENEMKPNIK